MDEKQNQTREVSVLDVFRSLKKKIKLVALITAIALILGAASWWISWGTPSVALW